MWIAWLLYIFCQVDAVGTNNVCTLFLPQERETVEFLSLNVYTGK